MQLQISDIQTKVTGKLRGATLDSVSDFYGKCQEAAGNVLSRCYPLETIRSSTLTSAIFDQIYNYVINQDIRGNKGLIDIRPISPRSGADRNDAVFPREFDIKKSNNSFAIEIVNTIKTLRLAKAVGSNAVVVPMDSVPTYFVAGGDLTNLRVNQYDYVSGIASVFFDLSGVSGSGTLSITLPQKYDFTQAESVASFFAWLKFIDASRLNSTRLRFGADAANYWEVTSTSPHDRGSYASGAWSLQRYDWASATKTGSPTANNIKYVQVAINYSTGTAINNNGFDAIIASQGLPFEVVYYTNLFFKGTNGTYKSKPTDSTDYINIEGTEGANLFLYELMLIIIQELGDKSVDKSSKWFMQQLNGYGEVPGLYSFYNRNYPCQSIPTQMTYWKPGNTGDQEWANKTI